MIKRLLTTFAVLTIMTAFAMAQVNEPIINSGTITNKGTIVVGCTVDGESILNEATGKITNDGTIQFTGDRPVFFNVTPTFVTNNGTIQFDGLIDADVMPGLGTATTDRLGGTVIYNGLVDGDNDQIIQGGFWYKNLTLKSAGAKTFTDGANYYVSAAYFGSKASGDGARTYGTSIFHYDGDVTSPQDIFAESNTVFDGTNHYYNLQFDNAGTKTIKAGETIAIQDEFGDADVAAVTILEAGKLILNDGIVAIIAGDITGTGATIQLLGTGTTGTFDVATTGSITFNDGAAASLFEMNGATVTNAGAMTFNDGKYDQISGHSIHSGTITLTVGDYVQTKGLVDISGTMTVTSGTFDINGAAGATDLVTITGTLDLAAATGLINMAEGTFMEVDGIFTSAATTNLTFAKTSTVTYDATAAQSIVATTRANSFGNLELFGTGIKTPVVDIVVNGNFFLTASDLDMDADTLVMLDPTSTVKYGDGTAALTNMDQVIGMMKRVMTGSINTALTFNNTATTVTMTKLGLKELTLNVTPGATPTYTGSGTYAAVDVKRTIGFTYTTTATDWLATMSYGYEYGELPGGLQTDAAQQLLRYREILTDNTDEKVSTGNDPDRTSTLDVDTWGQVTLVGINDKTRTTLAEITSGDDLFLRGGPTTFITIADGRWSNPATWDEGMQPSSTDNTEIKHTVHVGFEGGSDKGDVAGQKDERDNNLAGGNALAQSILITDAIGAALVFGDNPNPTDNDPGHNSSSLKWAMNADGIITNANTNLNVPTKVANLALADLKTFIDEADGEIYNGLIIFDAGVALRPISLSTQQLVNTAGEVMVGPNTVLQICQ